MVHIAKQLRYFVIALMTSEASSSPSTLSQQIRKNLESRGLNEANVEGALTIVKQPDDTFITTTNADTNANLNCQEPDWSVLSDSCKIAAYTLGFESSTWGQYLKPEIFSNSWEELTELQLLAVDTFGYTEDTWNSTTYPVFKVYNCAFTTTYATLSAACQGSALILGYSQSSWDANVELFTVGGTKNVLYNSLTSLQQQAAVTLGYTQSTWDSKVGNEENEEMAKNVESFNDNGNDNDNDNDNGCECLVDNSEDCEAFQEDYDENTICNCICDGWTFPTNRYANRHLDDDCDCSEDDLSESPSSVPSSIPSGVMPSSLPSLSLEPSLSPTQSKTPTIAPTTQLCKTSFHFYSILFFVVVLPLGLLLTGLPSLIFPCCFPFLFLFMVAWYSGFTLINTQIVNICPTSNFLGITLNNRLFGSD